MCYTAGRFTPVVLLPFLAVICMTVPFVLCLEAETHGWNSLGKEADALDSLLSGLEMSKLQNLLKNIPPAELQKVASRLIGEVETSNTEMEKRKSILQAIKKEGILDSWKKDLDSLIFDENTLPIGSDDKAKEFQSNLKCTDKSGEHSQHKRHVLSEDASKQKMEEAAQHVLGNPATNEIPSDTVKEQLHRDDVDYLFQMAEETFDAPSEQLLSSKLSPPPSQINKQQPPSKPAVQEKKRTEAKKKPNQKNNQEPLGALVGMAKKLLGQDESDPTLDIVANMASAYMKNMDNSASPKKNGGNNGPDLNSLLQMASLFSGGGGDNGNAMADNPLQTLTSLLTNSGMDMGQMLQMGSMLMGQGMDNSVSRKNKPTSPIIELIIRTVANFLNMDSVLLLDYYNGLAKLVEANSWNEINTILRKTTGTDVEALLDLLGNDDIRQQISDSTTSTVVHWFQDFLDPEGLNTKIFYLNALSQQYNYPLVDSKNVIETLAQLIERLSVDHLDAKIDLRPYLKHTEKQLRSLLHLEPYEKIDFRKFSERELSIAVQHTMKTEVFDSLSELWSDFRIASRFPKCARTVLCRRNVPNYSRTGLKQGITRATR